MARPRKPTKLKVIQGNPGGRPLNDDEPQPEVPKKIPAPPAGLSKEAAKHWKNTVQHLVNAQVYTLMDEMALRMYCEAYAEWVTSQKEIERNGSVVFSPNGYPAVSPYVTINNKAWDKMYKILTEFGMTPASRSKVKVAKKADDNGDDGFSNL